MKKIIALVLAVVLSLGALSVFAAAAPSVTDSDRAVTAGGAFSYTFNLSGVALDGMKVQSVKGTNIKEIKFNGKMVNGAPVLNKYDLDKATANTDGIKVVFKDYLGTSTKDIDLSVEFTLRDADGVRHDFGPFTTDDIVVAVDVYDGDTAPAVKNTVYTAVEKAEVESDFTVGDITADLKAKVAKGAKFNLTYSATTPEALEEAYPWNDLYFLNVLGSTAALGAWEISFNDQEAGAFVYGYKDGKLYNLPEGSFGYVAADETVVVKGTGTIPTLVLSATDLKVTATTAPTSSVANPGTGSSDMIGVAVVMAVVSLGAAGAVAFKKASK